MKHSTKIFIEDCELVDDKIYFFSRDWNGLYAINYKSEEIKFIGMIPEEHIFSKRLCAGIVHYQGKLILVPMTAEKIWIYDLKIGQWKGLERKYVTGRNRHKEIFKAVKYKEYLFFIGSNYPAIIQMNIDTYELKYFTEPYDFLKPKKKEDGYFRCDFCVQNNYLLAASCLNNYVLRLNLDTFEYEWCEVGDKDFCYSGIAWDGKDYWLSPRAGTPIVKWDGEGEVEYFLLPEDFDNATYNFLGVQYSGEKLIFPGMLQNKTIIINPENPKKVEMQSGQYTFFKCFGKNGELSQTIDGLLQLKLAENSEEYKMCLEIQQSKLIDCYLNEMGKAHYKKNNSEIQAESAPLMLTLYIALLNDKNLSKNDKLKIGVNIWKEILN